MRIESKKGPVEFTADEHPKPEVTYEKISTMKALFKKDGLVTAATASGIVDGAATSLLCSESYAATKGLKPLARIVSYASVGCDPKIMGIGPAGASRLALERAGLKLEQMDLIEVNEAFAPVPLVWQHDLDADPAKLNPRGGAIALGHPLGGTGTRILATLVNHLEQSEGRYGLMTMCEAGGLANATIIERL